MCRRTVVAGLLVPLLLLGCQSDQSNDTVQFDETLDLSPEETDVGPQEQNNVAYIETFSADGQRKLSPSVHEATMADLHQAHLDYSFSGYISHASTEANYVSSPFDQQQLLSMVALGAAGTTLQAISSASGFNLNDMDVHSAINDWEQQVDGFISLERQSFLWGQERYVFSERFLQNQAELYGPHMSGFDFQAAAADSQNKINDTLAGNFEFTEIDDRSRLVVAQTSEFDAGWSAELSVESVSGRFAVLADDEQRWVDMLRINGVMNVIEADDYRAVEVPLADSTLSLLLITPVLGEFDNLLNRFDKAFLQEQLEKFAPAQASVMLPRFEIIRELAGDEMPDLGVALLGPEAPEVVFDENGVPQWVLNDEGEYEVLVVETEVDPDTVANFTSVNNEGYLYLLPPKQRVVFDLEQVGVNSLTESAVVHEATNNEPDYLFSSPGGGTGGTWSGSFVSALPSNEVSCFYPPDQRPFLFAVYSRQAQSLLHLGHVVELSGARVEADWTGNIFDGCGDSPSVQVYQYTGALQCDVESGISLVDMENTLLDAGISVLESYEGYDGFGRPAVCGAGTGEINVFTINEHNVSLAEGLGFQRLSELLLE